MQMDRNQAFDRVVNIKENERRGDSEGDVTEHESALIIIMRVHETDYDIQYEAFRALAEGRILRSACAAARREIVGLATLAIERWNMSYAANDFLETLLACDTSDVHNEDLMRIADATTLRVEAFAARFVANRAAGKTGPYMDFLMYEVPALACLVKFRGMVAVLRTSGVMKRLRTAHKTLGARTVLSKIIRSRSSFFDRKERVVRT